MVPQTAMEAIMDISVTEPRSGIVLSLQETFRPVAVTCPTSVKVLPEDVRQIVLFPTPDLEAAMAYLYREKLHLLFFKWKTIRKGGRDEWVLDTRLTHTKFEKTSSLTMQLYPDMRLVELRDGKERFLGKFYNNPIPEKEIKRFPGAGEVDLERMLKFAISD